MEKQITDAEKKSRLGKTEEKCGQRKDDVPAKRTIDAQTKFFAIHGQRQKVKETEQIRRKTDFGIKKKKKKQPNFFSLAVKRFKIESQ